jgi:hypothetical protein
MWVSMELNQDILVRSTSPRTIDRTTSRWSPIASKVGLKDANAAFASFALLCGACSIHLDVVRSIVRGGTKLFWNFLETPKLKKLIHHYQSQSANVTKKYFFWKQNLIKHILGYHNINDYNKMIICHYYVYFVCGWSEESICETLDTSVFFYLHRKSSRLVGVCTKIYPKYGI